LDPELREALEALPRRGKKVFRFVEARNGKPVGDIAVSHRVVEIAHAAGVRLTFKSLRRGFGCYWASRVPAQVLQKLMRHANIRITMEYYANVDDAAVQAIQSRQRGHISKDSCDCKQIRNSGSDSPVEQEQENATNDGQSGSCA
jgi:integrase